MSELMSSVTDQTPPLKKRGRPPKNSAAKKLDQQTSDDSSMSKTTTPRKKYQIVDINQQAAGQKLLYQRLRKFYQNGIFEKYVLPILLPKNMLKEEKPIALRHIEWLVINYAVAFPVVYPDPVNPSGEPFNVNDSYILHEKNWGKKLFDPNARGDRIMFTADNGIEVVTTLGQLNFMMWAIKYGVIEWAIAHKKEIREHHKIAKKKRQEYIKSEPNREKKRMRLTQPDKTHCLVYSHAMSINIHSPPKNNAPSFDKSTNALP